MSRWSAHRKIVFNYSIILLNKRFQSCFLANAAVNLIISVLLSSIDQNMQTTLRIENYMIFELTRWFENSSIVLVINFKKILKRIIVWWKNKNIASSNFVIILKNLKKRVWKFFVLTNFDDILTSAKVFLLFKIWIS